MNKPNNLTTLNNKQKAAKAKVNRTRTGLRVGPAQDWNHGASPIAQSGYYLN